MAEAGAISPPAVLTGIGLALPSGDSLDALWRQWLAQTPAWRPFQSDWIDSQTVCCFGAVAPELHARARENLPHRLRRYATRSSGLGVLAIGDALRQSGFDPGGVPDPVRFGLYTAQGDQTTPSLLSFQGAVAAQPRPGPLEGLDMARLTHDALYRRGMDPFLAIKALANNLLALASLTHRFRGEGGAFVQGESATCAALDAALFALRSGLCDVAVVAAAGTHGEAWNLAEMSRAGWLGHGAAQAASLRSFDRGRDGTVPAAAASWWKRS